LLDLCLLHILLKLLIWALPLGGFLQFPSSQRVKVRWWQRGKLWQIGPCRWSSSNCPACKLLSFTYSESLSQLFCLYSTSDQKDLTLWVKSVRYEVLGHWRGNLILWFCLSIVLWIAAYPRPIPVEGYAYISGVCFLYAEMVTIARGTPSGWHWCWWLAASVPCLTWFLDMFLSTSNRSDLSKLWQLNYARHVFNFF